MRKSTFRRLGQYLGPYRAQLAIALLGALVSVPLSLLGPVLLGRAIDAILGKGDVDFARVGMLLLWYGATVAGSALFNWLMQVKTRTISARAAQDIRRDAFARLSAVPVKTIDTHPHGDLVSRLVNDTDAVAEGLLQGLTQLLPGVITIVGTIAIMLSLNVSITLVVLFISPLSIFFARFVARRSSAFFKDLSRTQGSVSAYVNESVENLNLLQAFGYEEPAQGEFDALTDRFHSAYFKATFSSSIANPGTRFVNALVYAAVGVAGALFALQGRITVGGISAFLSFANQYTKPFNEVSAVMTQMQTAMAGAERLFEVIDWQTELPDAPDALAPRSAAGDVKAMQAYFSYDPARPLIRDFSFDAQHGQTIALVGPTGCGKTTIINLLMRFYELDSGAITVDGNNAAHIRRSALRGLYGMVLQDTWLKEASVRDNIAYGKPQATLDEVVEAAKAAYAHSFIKRLPQGYDTVIGAGGGTLSAGQRQLLCIARVMLEKPDILILDEATSSIDTRTEMLIQKALDRLMEGHTSFVVAHRLSTIQNADQILVMRAGEVVERGTHTQLLQQNGFYARLFNSQFAPST